MGFRCEMCHVVGGSEEFPTGETKELRRSRAEVLLKKCAQCLIDCNVGWSLDVSRCATLNSFINIQCFTTNDSLPAPGLLFINSISGCKLLMFYEPFKLGTKNYNGTSNFLYGMTTYNSGLCISIIPSGSNSVFGDPSTDTFYPDDATRVCGSYYRSSYSSSHAPAAENPVNGTYYLYYILASQDCVAICANHHTDISCLQWVRPAVPTYSTGKIFDKLAHEEDNTPQAKYGTMVFRYEIGYDNYEAWARVRCWESFPIISNGSNYNIFGYKDYINNPSAICFTNSNGEWLNAYSDTYRLYFPASWMTLSPNACNKLPWSAFIAVQVSTDIATNGVIPGDGFKGILDTEYFRAVGNADGGTLFNNGKFLIPETNLGIAIGWDPNNR